MPSISREASTLKHTPIYFVQQDHLSAQNHPHNTMRLDFQKLNSVCSSRDIPHNGNKGGTLELMEAVHRGPLSKMKSL